MTGQNTVDASGALVLTSLEQMRGLVHSHLGYSAWLPVEQARIDQFAEATGDFQWIHVDAGRAAEGPFGTTIAHGWLSASLLPVLTGQIYRVQAKMAVNYGVNRLRFISPVKVGSQIRAGSTLVDVTEHGPAVQLTVQTEVEINGSEKPALVVESLGRYYL
ncbi:MaoC family dehydratase [Nocardia coffeae]|uniref:MaoC family dehydratase n=1 Tax=Nocardia coffeae TaxID=2873381 RepID=UPI0027DF740C|nr:MaoC family dehydratase [Nocardia coffeae]